jgi:hypothetical protein
MLNTHHPHRFKANSYLAVDGKAEAIEGRHKRSRAPNAEELSKSLTEMQPNQKKVKPELGTL